MNLKIQFLLMVNPSSPKYIKIEVFSDGVSLVKKTKTTVDDCGMMGMLSFV